MVIGAFIMESFVIESLVIMRMYSDKLHNQCQLSFDF